jgi:hypothetical protein
VLIVAGLLATLAMVFATSSASARSFSLSNQQFRITWTMLLLYTEGAGVNPRTECPVTLEGSFHSRTIAKVRERLIGYVTRAISPNARPPCAVDGSYAFLNESLPWHVTYESFTGALPRIETIRVAIHGVNVKLRIGMECLYQDRGEAAGEVLTGEFRREGGGAITTFTPVGGVLRRFLVATCPPNMFIERTEGEVFLLNSSTVRIRLTLI